MIKNEKYLNFVLLFFSFLIGIFILNFIIDYLIYQKNFQSKYYLDNPNFNTKLQEINLSIEKVEPNIGSLISNPTLTRLAYKKKKLIFGDAHDSNIILCNENGQYVVFKSDKYGFRNDNKNYLDQNFIDGKMPIIIGDSFGIGVCVRNEFYLKNIKKKVLNLSVSGSGPTSQMSLIKEFLKKFKTNKIIWLFYEGNDLLDLEIEKKNIIFKEYFKKDSSWTNYSYFDDIKESEKLIRNYTDLSKNIKDKHQYSFKDIIYGKEFSLKRLVKLTALRNIYRNNKSSLNYNKSLILNDYLTMFTKLNNELVNKNIEVKFIFLPDYKSVMNRQIRKSTQDLKYILNNNFTNVEILNFDNYLIENFSKEQVYINPRSHFTEEIYIELYNYINKIL